MAVATPAFPATGVSVPNGTGQKVAATFTGGTTQCVASSPPVVPPVTTPAIPASTVTATNNNPYPVLVAITGGTTTVIAVNSVTVATTTPANVVVPAGGTIAITYSVVPTGWTWTAIFAGVCGNPITAPFSVPVPPGGGITPFFTAAATWAWTDPEEVQETPGYSQENVQAEATGYNPDTALPLNPHPEGGQTGLGTGVSN